MNFHVLTLFPEMIEQGLQTSITGRAMKNNTISLQTVNIRDYSENKHNQVDDYPYGGGAGMVMAPGPVYRAYKAVEEGIFARDDNSKDKKLRVIYLTPQGRVLIKP